MLKRSGSDDADVMRRMLDAFAAWVGSIAG